LPVPAATEPSDHAWFDAAIRAVIAILNTGAGRPGGYPLPGPVPVPPPVLPPPTGIDPATGLPFPTNPPTLPVPTPVPGNVAALTAKVADFKTKSQAVLSLYQSGVSYNSTNADVVALTSLIASV
jgi:hypothetical protein